VAELTGPFTVPDGAFVEIVVGISRAHLRSLRSQLRPIPLSAFQTVTLQALMDSGAECTLLDSNAARGLGLPFVSPVPVNMGGSGLSLGRQVRGSLTILNPNDPAQPLEIPDCPLVECDLSLTPYEAIISRDVLARCVLTLDGPAGTFTLRY
jgi:hypothetical protein